MPLEDNYFEECKEINNLINNNDEKNARNKLIQLLDKIGDNSYTPIINHLIRQLGLFPYIKDESSLWDDLFVKNCFSTDIGNKHEVVLHREQSLLLKKLLEGRNIAVSAPTSFGKSFVVDAFIKIKNPKNVMILVPTIALTDETRRRIYKRFSKTYNIITTVNEEMQERNIFIFPQERVFSYIPRINELDILIIDEFYKSSSEFEPDRSPALVKAMIKLNSVAKQKYYLAPNISSINDNPFTENMEKLNLNFNTVFLEVHNLYTQISNEDTKREKLVDLINTLDGKTLVYAGTHAYIHSLSELLIDNIKNEDNLLLTDFSNWLCDNYTSDWTLPKLIIKGIGIHTGKIHRSLSQLQIKIFEETGGLSTIISTSSIIEGVNTSAENVILWTKKNGSSYLNSFSYKNVVGRAGRMFKYFVGHIYVLERPPEEQSTQLNIEFPEEILGELDVNKDSELLTAEQINIIKLYDQEMIEILGKENYDLLKSSFQSTNSNLIKNIAQEIFNNKKKWKRLGWLNSDNPDDWDSMLYATLRLQGGGWDTTYTNFVNFIKIISNNWNKTIKGLLEELNQYNIDLDLFFVLERNVSFKLCSLLKDVNILQLNILKDDATDISPFINKIASVFLPYVVYELEEYGLPRMISKKIERIGVINFQEEGCTLASIISKFKEIGKENLIQVIEASDFEKYIIDYFYDGITAD